jgi:hypothetical protein
MGTEAIIPACPLFGRTEKLVISVPDPKVGPDSKETTC